jgi:catechol 2,3-dioxygenase-like lactoylglutathione lyase family enzyme
MKNSLPIAMLLLVPSYAASAEPPAASAAPAVPAVPAAAPATEQPTQSILLRAVSITYDLGRSLLFYRDILGQDLIEDNSLNAERSASWLEVSPQAKIRFVVLRGKAEYPGGPITGGRIAFIAIDDPAHPRSSIKPSNHRGVHGDMILPHRVANLDGIVRRLHAAGFEFLFEPRVSPSGLSRNCMVYDPNGHIVELFELK